ncbi:MAG: tryptophan synthase subunit alpha [Corynebacterium sp.]|nr:tryptophan synthase subunit alpha [Corynebacterium sp.]MDO5077613.1 tryptophan synthase subunit alpha [Corynebacterium sp.]
MTNRYAAMFERLGEEGAFVPFFMLGDPDPETSFEIIQAAIEGGADALELGIPFSDPVADGPTIQLAHIRALRAGVDVNVALDIVRKIRNSWPELPIGLLIYGNVAFARGMEQFYADVAASGADSVLLPDVPVREGRPFAQAAIAAGIDPIFIAPPHATPDTLVGVAENSRGYTYAVSRVGVTGSEWESSTDGLANLVKHLKSFGGPPALLGFGISTPEHVANAVKSGAAGAICGSALSKIIETHDGTERIDAVRTFVAEMKAATKV